MLRSTVFSCCRAPQPPTINMRATCTWHHNQHHQSTSTLTSTSTVTSTVTSKSTSTSKTASKSTSTVSQDAVRTPNPQIVTYNWPRSSMYNIHVYANIIHHQPGLQRLQPFGEGKNGHKNFRQARTYYFHVNVTVTVIFKFNSV